MTVELKQKTFGKAPAGNLIKYWIKFTVDKARRNLIIYVAFTRNIFNGGECVAFKILD